MKTNESLQKDVQEAIKWEPILHASEISVMANDGIVTLTGTVDNYIKKNGAERAAKNVKGVKAVLDEIKIKYNRTFYTKTDLEIVNEVITALKKNWNLPQDTISVKVENGWVKLDGNLAWNYQKESANNSIKNIEGLIGITNNIVIKSDNIDSIEKEAIEKALHRNGQINSNDIKVTVTANEVTLKGEVSFYYQKDEAERIAWNAPGVWSVNNELSVNSFE